jgi:integrase
MSGNYFRKAIKQPVVSVGLDPRQFSGHSLRSGGATDLFEARVAYHIIKKMGRWKLEAAIRYYRCEDDVIRAVKKAFSRMSKKIYKTPA